VKSFLGSRDRRRGGLKTLGELVDEIDFIGTEIEEEEQRRCCGEYSTRRALSGLRFYMSLSISSIYRVGKRESNPFCLHAEVAGLNMWERELPVANANDPSG